MSAAHRPAQHLAAGARYAARQINGNDTAAGRFHLAQHLGVEAIDRPREARPEQRIDHQPAGAAASNSRSAPGGTRHSPAAIAARCLIAAARRATK